MKTYLEAIEMHVSLSVTNLENKIKFKYVNKLY